MCASTGPARFFYDTEFLEDGHGIDLISIGIVDGDSGAEYYAVCADADWERIAANRWLCDNVVPYLPLTTAVRYRPAGTAVFAVDAADPAVKPRRTIAAEVARFMTRPDADRQGRQVELWAYYGAFDHVVLSWLWGAMVDLPPGVPMWTHDVMQLCSSLGYPDLPQQSGDEHHALADARHVRSMWRHLESLGR